MHIVTKVIRREEAHNAPAQSSATVTLTFAERRRSRQRLRLDNNEGEIGLSIDRGAPLREGDILVTQEARCVLVKAAPEDVVRVTAPLSWQLARAAYHLGNRHVLIEVTENFLQFEYDAVLVDMLNQLGGVTLQRSHAIFEPDTGAYGGGHRHGHDASFNEDYALAQHAYHAHDKHHHDDHGHEPKSSLYDAQT